jgi:CBS domain-containing protein
VLFIVGSLTPWGGPMLALIAAFVFLGAQQELAYARLRETAQSLRVGQAMITRFQTLPISLKVAEIAASLAGNSQKVFPFVDERLRLHGFANREELEKAAHELPAQAQANCIARRLPTVHPDTRFEEALELMQQSSEPLLPVVNASGQIVGLVSVGHLAELSASRQPGVAL